MGDTKSPIQITHNTELNKDNIHIINAFHSN